MELKEKIIRLFELEKLATIATVNSKTNQPESALIAYAEDSTLNLYFQTACNTRKYANLLSNPQVALVIGFGNMTLQYEGLANEIGGTQEIEYIKQLFFKKNSPTTKDFLDRINIAFFKIEPTWIGYSDYSFSPPDIQELKSF